MPPDFTIRQVHPEDDSRVADYRALRIQLWPDCEQDCDREIAEILAAPDRWAAFVISLNSRESAAGFIEVHLREFAEGASESPVAFVEGWFILPEQRQSGLGKALMQAAEAWALSRGSHELGSDTQPGNQLSIEVHKQLGFREVERLVCFLKQL